MEKSLLLALGLAIGASSLDGVRGRGPMAHPAEERLRAAAAAVSLGATAVAGPRLVLLPPVARAVPAASPGDAAAPSPEARRDEFLRRARRLVDAGAAAGPPVR